MKPIIKWNANYRGVEIQTEGQHFVISAKPSMVMSWDDAVRYFEGDEKWQLPTKGQLQLIRKHIHEVNDLIKENGGYKIFGLHWTADEYNDFCAWNVYLYNGYTSIYNKSISYYVRAVSAFQN